MDGEGKTSSWNESNHFRGTSSRDDHHQVAVVAVALLLMGKLTLGLESSLLAGSVLDLPHFSLVVHVAVLSVDLSVRVLGLDLERSVGSLEAKGVGTVVIVTVDLLQDGHRGRCGLLRGVLVVVVVLLLGQRNGCQAENDDLERRNDHMINISVSTTVNLTRKRNAIGMQRGTDFSSLIF